jgi:NADPH-dependent glutamate synthase beta subunit-like oxidoreductase/NAD(P)H-flavin reductase
MNVGFGIVFDDLYRRDGLVKLDGKFCDALKAADAALHNRLMSARANPNALADKDHSQLLLDLAPHVDDFIGELFSVEKDISLLSEKHDALAPLYACKRLFVQRRASKALALEEANRISADALLSVLPLVPVDDPHFELVFAKVVMSWLAEEEKHKSPLEIAARYACWALITEAGHTRHGKGILFKQPKKLDPEYLIPVETEIKNGVRMLKLADSHLRARDGFALTDDGGTLAHALDHAHYCIFCHHQGKDSCSKGFRVQSSEFRVQEKNTSLPNSEPRTPNSVFKKNASGVDLHGCPLDEKISEMNELKAKGVIAGSLAVVVIDNPMCAGTGHRICNDCMKSCIYQKQEPVNVPLIETHVLRDVLQLPYGFEIYSLFTRWNPLNIAQPLPKAESGYRVLVAGLGPAGYTLSHYLLNDGHTVVGIDGLKIEPLPERLSGVTALGEHATFEPIKDINMLYEKLDERAMAGFGGVAEYGITVRWDKNYLKIIRLLLERRRHFSMIGGVRFGSNITYDNAFALGFDHIALAMGAGAPTLIDMPNGLARGVRMASDFLMGLQLTGAAKKDSIANLQLRLPAVIIGGGLTAIDTATEALAYYPVQVEKFLARYETLIKERGEQAVRASWSREEADIAEEFLTHARAISAERAKAQQENRAANFLPLLKLWGGVKIVYRKRLQDAPSYRLNHEEVEKALEEGIEFCEDLEPVAVEVDGYGHVCGLRLNPVAQAQPASTGSRAVQDPALPLRGPQDLNIPARAILIAAGTKPNTVLAREDAAHFTLDGKYFTAVDENGNAVKPERSPKPNHTQVLMSFDHEGGAVSFFGDLHPSFSGSVVKAMASAKRGYPVISRVLRKSGSGGRVSGSGFIADMNRRLRATVYAVNRLTPTIVEVLVQAPLAAKQFQPGQFYRLQNFEINASATRNPPPATRLAMEGLAMTGAWVDKEKGLVSVIVLEMGGSSDLCAYLKPGEPVVLMGPTGTPTHIPQNETVLLAGGGLGNAVLFSIGKAMRAKGCKVLYFAGYRKAVDRYKTDEIEAAADQIVWCCDETLLAKNRPQDASFHGNIVEAMSAYAKGLCIGDWGLEKNFLMPSTQSLIPLSSITHLIAIGSDRMMAAVAHARHHALKPYLNPGHTAIGSINSPMQCMMKEICAQCLQEQVDPVTGRKTYVYSCFNQDQYLDEVSFMHLQARLKQNAVEEKLTGLWIDSCLKHLKLRRDAA